jgi:hypothetical protein
MVVIKRDATILVVTEKGLGKCSHIDDYRVQKRGGKGIITVNRTEKTGDVVGVMEVLPEDEIMLITRNGVIIRSSVAQIRVTGRIAQGVRLVHLDEGDVLDRGGSCSTGGRCRIERGRFGSSSGRNRGQRRRRLGLTEAWPLEKEVIDELQSLRAALRNAEAELQRVREEGESRRDLVDILHEVMGDLPTDEIFHFPRRRLARALRLSHASVIKANRGAKPASSPPRSSSLIFMISRSSSTATPR